MNCSSRYIKRFNIQWRKVLLFPLYGFRRHSSTINYHEPREINVKFSNEREMTLSWGRYARFADSTAVCQMGNTAVMVTAVAKSKPQPGGGFVPLVVDYRLKNAASGRIPMNWARRELGPSEKEILSGRLVDRSVRALFPSDYRCETQLICNMLAMDAVHPPDILAINAASAALTVSGIPWNGPVGAVRIGLCDGEILVNPTRREMQSSQLDLVVTATTQSMVVMLEGRADAVFFHDLCKAIKCGTREAHTIVLELERLQKMIERTNLENASKISSEDQTSTETVHKNVDEYNSEEITEAVRSMSEMRLREIFQDNKHDKMSRDRAVNEVRTMAVEKVWSSYPTLDPAIINEEFNRLSKSIFRELLFESNRRCDGRSFNDLRDISCKVDLYKPLHGSCLFQRGQTQVFCTVALDSQESAMKLDNITSLESGLKAKNFMLHYEFPPYATGEVGRIGPIGRRELGHGALAEKALLATIPNDFPFTIRLTSEVLESNGSSSMATVCGGSMALMDAGVPVSALTAGVAIGLVAKYENNDTKHLKDYRILTDILGIEDYMGDMDMKVAGTSKGFTAIQADLKIPGVPLKVIMESLQKAHDAKGELLEIMGKVIKEPRKNRKDCWPLTERVTIEPHQRAQFVGPGGLNMKRLYVETGATVTAIDETNYTLFAPSKSAIDEAKEMITSFLMPKDRIPDLDFGGIYSAQITEIRDIGVMIVLYPGMPPTLLHNSQLDQKKVAHPSALGLEVGQEIKVKYFGRDPVSGFMRLSRKVLQPTTGILRTLTKSIPSIVDSNSHRNLDNVKTETSIKSTENPTT